VALTETRGRIEQRVLGLSIGATLIVACVGVAFGALTWSFSILFDGVYAGIDAAMSGLALLVARLIVRDAAGDTGEVAARRFQFGFWHLEPMVLALNGMMLTLAAIYALGNAVLLLLSGGRLLAFDWAMAYAAVVLAICLGMAWWEARMNRLARSEFVALDARAWLMSGAITGALLVAFITGYLAEGTAADGWRPYLDPGVLALVCLCILPLPMASMVRALRDIFLVAPADLDGVVRAAAEAVASRHGFPEFRSHVARMGRSSMIEVHFIAPADRPAAPLADYDAIRDELGAAIGGRGPNRWLTIAFTTRPDWAE
jgi:predicted Co/Zn/Cd cation transporter (cation efflux family)